MVDPLQQQNREGIPEMPSKPEFSESKEPKTIETKKEFPEEKSLKKAESIKINLIKPQSKPADLETKSEQSTKIADLEAKKEKIISRLTEAALAMGGDDENIQKIMENAKNYTAKGYPSICKEVYIRVREARNRGIH